MKFYVSLLAGMAVLACGTAAAQTVPDAPTPETSLLPQMDWSRNFTISEAPQAADPNALSLQEKSQTLHFGGNGRWQMNIDLITRPDDSPLPREEYTAGAMYQFTPRFSLGGSLSVGAQELDDVSRWQEQEVEAGVRLETTFKF